MSRTFLDVDRAVTIARESTGLDISRRDIDLLLKFGLVPNFGTNLEPSILEEHARLLTGRVGTEIEVALASLRTADVPAGLKLDGHELVQLTPQIALSFDPEHVSIPALQALIRSIRSASAPVVPKGEWNQTLTMLEGGPCVWAAEKITTDWLVTQWRIADSKEAKTSLSEALCVPMLYGSKGRVSSFIVSTIRQHLATGSPLCDLMTGTGLVARHLLAFYPVHANDAALFATRLVAAQNLDIDQKSAEATLQSMRPYFEKNFHAIGEIFRPAIETDRKSVV